MANIKKLDKQNIEDILPLTPLQEGMLYHYLSDAESRVYYEQLSLRLKGHISIQDLKKAWNYVANSNEILRTIYRWEKIEKPVQIVLKKLEPIYIEYDLSGVDHSDIECKLEKIRQNNMLKKIDLNTNPLLLTFCILSKDECELIILNHHILYDGWSNGIIINEFLESYNCIIEGIEPTRKYKTKYKEFINYYSSLNKQKLESFWKEQLECVEPNIYIHREGKKVSTITNSDVYSLAISDDVAKKIDRFNTEHNITLAAFFYSVWGVLLSKYSDLDDVVFGTTVSGRNSEIKDIENIVGLFINTLPVRLRISGNDSVIDVLKRMSKILNDRVEYENLSIQDIKTVSKIESDRELFDSLVVVENYPLDKVIKSQKGRVAISKYLSNEMTNFDLTLQISVVGNLVMNLVYNCDIYSFLIIKGVMSHLANIIDEMIKNHKQIIKDMNILSQEDEHNIHSFNGVSKDYPYDRLIFQEFETRASEYPDKVALIFDGREMTYRSLNERANKLASLLRKKGASPDSIIGIIAERSFELIIGIMAILKSGSAYLPIDPAYPAERKQYIIDDSGAQILLTQNSFIEGVDYDGVIVELVDYGIYDDEPGENITSSAALNNLAYVIYTSGSTGNPKGVMIEHRNMLNLLWDLQEKYPLNTSDAYLFKTTHTFDVSVAEIFGWFLGGGRLVILNPGQEKEPKAILKMIEKYGVTHISFVPSMLSVFLDLLDKDDYKTFDALKYVIAAGEVLPVSLVRSFYSIAQNTKLENLYGPTEATVYASYYSVEREAEYTSIPIGRPISNLKLCILGKNNDLKPIGVPGELCICGVGVARGYLNRPELTMEKFVTSPLDDGLMYRTGDLARWLPDGTVEYLGRLDFQVKIRGFRIELGEIEEKLKNHQDVKEAVVLAKEDKNFNKYLVAYIVLSGDVQKESLRDYLLSEIPDYMVPSYFVYLERIPLLQNGKINRKDLKQVEDNEFVAGQEYVPPRNEIEQRLVEVWKDVLGIEHLGIEDKFYDLGGDSIKAMKIAARIQKFDLKLEIKEILKNQKISEISRFVVEDRDYAEQDTVVGEVGLTPIQKSFFEYGFTDMHHFNQSHMIIRQDGFDEVIIKETFNLLTEHHDALRMFYRHDEKGYVQYNKGLGESYYDFYVFDLKNEKDYKLVIDKENARIQEGIDLKKGPLVKLALFKTLDGDKLLIVIHHLVIDGVSWRILLEDFAYVYKLLSKGNKVVLPKKTTSFKEWSDRLAQYAKSKDVEKIIKYWEDMAKEKYGVLPFDHDASNGKVIDSSICEFSLDEKATNDLLKSVSRAYNTDINEVLLTALGTSLKDWIGSDSLLIDMEGHGREEIIKGLTLHRTIGWFTSFYPVRLDMKGYNKVLFQESISGCIKLIKESIRKIPNKGIDYGILKYLRQNKHEDLYLQLRPQISFNYLGQIGEEAEYGDLFRVESTYSIYDVSPQMERVHSIEIIAAVVSGKFNFRVSYNKRQYNDETIANFTMGFENNLRKIIDHCLHKDIAELTPSDMANSVITIEELDKIVEDFASKNTRVLNIYSLSSMQEGMLFHWILNNKSTAYFQQCTFNIKGSFDRELFGKALNQLVARYDVLRTVFIHEGLKKPQQVVLSDMMINLEYKKISYIDEMEKESLVEEFKKKDIEAGFNLAEGPLMRIAVFELNDYWHKVIWSYHHILMDGWCLGILLDELVKRYRALDNSVEVELEQVSPYRDYIKWMENWNKLDAVTYWNNRLLGASSTIVLGQSLSSVKANYERKEMCFLIRENQTRNLKELAKRSNVTLNVVFQSIWVTMLQKYNNSYDVVFGAVVSGRHPEVTGIEKMMGLFINTIPVRIIADNKMSFTDLMCEVQNVSNESKNYEFLSLAEIQANSGLKHDLINNIMVFENYPFGKSIENNDQQDNTIKITNIETFEQTTYDFNINIIPGASLIEIKFNYNGLIYDDNCIELIKGHFEKTIDIILQNPDIKLMNIDILTKKERSQILYEFNNTEVSYPNHRMIHEMLEETANQKPDNIALVFDNEILTYRQLNSKANSFGRVLRSKGVGVDTIVGIMIERSLEMIIAIMGILKAGGAYLPIDPKYPQDRIEYMLKDSGTEILVMQKRFKDVFKAGSDKSINVIYVEDDSLYSGDKTNLEKLGDSNNLAYVIYTSGSTGNPKGAMINHFSVINRIKWMQKKYPIYDNDLILQKTPYTFDVSVWELFWWSFQGAGVCLLTPGGEKYPCTILETIEKNKVTTIHFVPSMLNVFLDYLEDIEDKNGIKSLRRVFASGEALNLSQVERFNRLLHKTYGITLSNLYGPTEATVDVSYFDCSVGENQKVIPIGKPIDNIHLYVVDKSFKLLPVGAAGELCISGDGLARGYLKRPELTNEKFIPNPFYKDIMVNKQLSKKGFERMYRTGDLTRWLPDGNIEYLGRMDFQVKIRGYRIELGEIEARINEFEGITEIAVVDREDKEGNKYLCAYYVSDHEIEDILLRKHLSCTMPDYMIPSFFIRLDSMPLSLNGKLDRKALPEHKMLNKKGSAYVAPRNDLEVKMVELWKDILEVQDVGVEQSFFEVGGHSLKATTLVSRIKKVLGMELSLSHIFEYPTIRELVTKLVKVDSNIDLSINPVAKSYGYQLSSAQKRLYLIDTLKDVNQGYNMSAAIKITGKVDVEKFEKAFRQIVDRHESLRTSFHMLEGQPMQVVHNNIDFKLSFKNIQSENVESEIEKFIRPFDLKQAPLIRAALFSTDLQNHIFAVDMHHIISDGVSVNIIVREFMELYKGMELPALRLQYKDFANWQMELCERGAYDKQEQYWLDKFKGEIPELKLRTDFKRPQMQSFEGRTVIFEVDRELTDRLIKLSYEKGITLFMLLLAAYNVLLNKYTAQKDIVVGTPVAGRGHPDLEGIVGMFVNLVAIRNEIDEEDTFVKFLNEVRKSSLEAFENQDYQFEDMVEKLDIKRDFSRNPVFDTVMVFQNIDDKQMIIDDLKIEPVPYYNKVAKMDLAINVTPLEDKLLIEAEYCTKLFEEQTIKYMLKHFMRVLEIVTTEPGIAIKSIDILGSEEKTKILQSVEVIDEAPEIDFDF